MRVLLAILALGAAGFAVSCGGDSDSGQPPEAATTEQAASTPSPQPPETVAPTTAPSTEPQVTTIAEGLKVPWEIAFLPDGRALVTERAGRVRLLTQELTLEPEPVAEIDVFTEENGEEGLLGIAIDPEFESNGFVYLFRSTPDGSGNEVARYRFADDRLVEEAVVLEGIVAYIFHDGGRIHFGPDGALYVSTGDATLGDPARDPSSLNGKMLRLTDFRGEGGTPEIVSLGHRNVQGFGWQPGTDLLVATEFGPDANDEVNIIREGADYGWPDAQGDDSDNGSVPALVDFEDNIVAPSGATFVSQPGSAWSGNFLFACLRGQQLRRLVFDGEEVIENEALFEGEFGRLRTVVEGPDGALYVLTNNTDGRGEPREGDDRILRIVPPAA